MRRIKKYSINAFTVKRQIGKQPNYTRKTWDNEDKQVLDCVLRELTDLLVGVSKDIGNNKEGAQWYDKDCKDQQSMIVFI